MHACMYKKCIIILISIVKCIQLRTIINFIEDKIITLVVAMKHCVYIAPIAVNQNII